MTALGEPLTRRAALHWASLLLAGVTGLAYPGCSELRHSPARPQLPVRIGLVTDVHYADKAPSRTRQYRESLAKLSSAIARFNELKTDFVVELGDFIDGRESVEQELAYLRRIESTYAQARCPRHHVLGNHCAYALTKEQFLSQCGATRSWYSFDVGGFHFVILDGCFRQDGLPYRNKNSQWTDSNIPPAELEWLEADLAGSRRPAVVFIHQRLDGEKDYAVRQHAEVRNRLEASGRVRLVLQGHSHDSDFKEINGIQYWTLAAMVEGDTNAYGVLTLHENGTIRLDGFGRQESRVFTPSQRTGVRDTARRGLSGTASAS